MRAERIRLFCLCGDTMNATVKPPEALVKLKAAWLVAHSGEGHEPATEKICRQMRKLAERRTQ